MGKRDDLIAKYADDLKNKCKISPDMALLTKVTIGCGPSIYDNDAQTVAASDKDELERIQKNFLVKKLGLTDGAKLMEGINAANILVSFPSRSLGGRSKGMTQNYEAHFNQLMAGKNWQVTRFEFPGELAFLVRK